MVVDLSRLAGPGEGNSGADPRLRGATAMVVTGFSCKVVEADGQPCVAVQMNSAGAALPVILLRFSPVDLVRVVEALDEAVGQVLEILGAEPGAGGDLSELLVAGEEGDQG